MALFFEWAQTPADRGPLTKAHKKCTPRRRNHARRSVWTWTWCHKDGLNEADLEPLSGQLVFLGHPEIVFRPLRPRCSEFLSWATRRQKNDNKIFEMVLGFRPNGLCPAGCSWRQQQSPITLTIPIVRGSQPPQRSPRGHSQARPSLLVRRGS